MKWIILLSVILGSVFVIFMLHVETPFIYVPPLLPQLQRKHVEKKQVYLHENIENYNVTILELKANYTSIREVLEKKFGVRRIVVSPVRKVNLKVKTVKLSERLDKNNKTKFELIKYTCFYHVTRYVGNPSLYNAVTVYFSNNNNSLIYSPSSAAYLEMWISDIQDWGYDGQWVSIWILFKPCVKYPINLHVTVKLVDSDGKTLWLYNTSFVWIMTPEGPALIDKKQNVPVSVMFLGRRIWLPKSPLPWKKTYKTPLKLVFKINDNKIIELETPRK